MVVNKKVYKDKILYIVRPYSIVVSTWDFESHSPSSILGKAF